MKKAANQQTPGLAGQQELVLPYQELSLFQSVRTFASKYNFILHIAQTNPLNGVSFSVCLHCVVRLMRPCFDCHCAVASRVLVRCPWCHSQKDCKREFIN